MKDVALVIPFLILIQAATYLLQRATKTIFRLPSDCVTVDCMAADWILFAVILGCMFWVISWFYRWRRFPVQEDFRFSLHCSDSIWVLGILLLATAYFPVKHDPAVLWNGLAKLGLGAAVVQAIYILPDSLMGICREEFFHRGIVQSFLVRALSKTQGLLFAAVLFTATHLPGFAHDRFTCWRVAVTFALGLVFGLAYLRTRRIFVPLAMHLVWNLCARTSFAAASL